MQRPGPVRGSVSHSHRSLYLGLALAIASSAPGLRAVAQQADLVAVSFDAPAGSYRPGNSLLLGATVRNDGPQASGDYSVAIYASTNETITTGDRLLDSFIRDPVAIGAEDTFLALPDIPAGIPPDTYYIGMIVSSGGDPDPGNNRAHDPDPIEIAYGADVSAVSLEAPPGPFRPGDEFSVELEYINHGPDPASNVTVSVYLSKDTAISPADTLVHESSINWINPGLPSARWPTVQLPTDTAPGEYFVGVILSLPEDLDLSNNTAYDASAVLMSIESDLDVVSVNAPPGEYHRGNTLLLGATVENHGPVDCPGYTAAFYASGNDVITADDLELVRFDRPALAAGSSDVFIAAPALPPDMPRGPYYIGLIVTHPHDPQNSNNWGHDLDPILVVVPADLAVNAIDVPSRPLLPGMATAVVNTVSNAGPEPCDGYKIVFYASSNTIITPSDYPMGTVSRGVIDVGASQERSTPVTLPGDIPFGTYYVGAVVSYPDDPDLSDNVGHDPEAILVTDGADLAVDLVSSTSYDAHVGSSFYIFSSILNRGPERCAGYRIRYYASPDPEITTDDIRIKDENPGALEAGQEHNISYFCSLPGDIAEDIYYVGAIVTSGDDPTPDNDTGHDPDPVAVWNYTDLELRWVSAPTGVFAPGDPLLISSATRNNGPGNGRPDGYRAVFYASVDAVITSADHEIDRCIRAFPPADETREEQRSVQLPGLPPGVYCLGMDLRPLHTSDDPDFDNNKAVALFPISITQIGELGVETVAAPEGDYHRGETLLLGATVVNSGPEPVPGYTATFYASDDTKITAGDVELTSFVRGPVAARATDTFLAAPRIPEALGYGEQYIGLIATYEFDQDPANDAGHDPTPIEIVAAPEYARITAIEWTAPARVEIRWPSEPARAYRILRSIHPNSGFDEIVVDDIASTPPANTHAVPIRFSTEFYRVESR